VSGLLDCAFYRSVAGTASQNRGMDDREGVARGLRNRRLGDDLENRGYRRR
jgi:hypothetical protein